MRTLKDTWAGRVMVGLCLLLVMAVGCSNDDAPDATTDETPVTDDDASAEADEPIEETADEEAADEEPDDTAADAEPMVEVISQPAEGAGFDGERFRFPSFGGVELWVPDGLVVTHDAERLAVLDGLESYSFGLITSDLSGRQITSAEAYLELLAAVPDAVVEPLGERLEVLGVEVEGYQVTAPASAGPQLVYSFNPHGYFGPFGGSPFPSGVTFVGDTPNGVLELSFGTRDDAGMDIAAQRPIFDTIVESLRLTGQPLDEPIEYGPPFEFQRADLPVIPEPLADGPEILAEPFRPLDAGSYQFNEMFNLLGVEVAEDDWWIQPFFPGFVVFAEADNPGPGQRDLTMLGFVDRLVPVSAAPGAVGDPVEFASVDMLLEQEFPGLVIEDLGTVEFDGGVTAAVLDILIDPDAACSAADPCSYAFVNPTGDVWPLRPHLRTRVWHVTDVASPFMIFAADASDGWLDEAGPFIESIRFLG